MKTIRRAILPAILCALLLQGCASHRLDVVSMQPDAPVSYRMRLGELSFDPPHIYTGDRGEIRKLCVGLGRKTGFDILDRPDSGLPTITFYFRDTTYTKGFSNLHSIAAFADVVDANGNPIYKSFYYEDGAGSIQSLGELSDIIEATFLALRNRMENDREELEKARRKQEGGA